MNNRWGLEFFCIGAVWSGGGAVVKSRHSRRTNETAEPSSSTRPFEGGDESSSKRVRSHAGMLLFDENDTSDWQHSVHETPTSELSDDQHDQHEQH